MVKNLAAGDLKATQIVALSFIGAILGGALLLSLPWATVNGIRPVDALFTAASAVCVTGLVTVDVPSVFTLFGKIVILLLIQAGGLGIMTFAAVAMSLLHDRLSFSERSALRFSFLQAEHLRSIFSFVRFILLYTVIVEGLGFVGFLFFLDAPIAEGRIFNALFHAVSAFCNAGFSLYSDSLVRYRADTTVNLITMGLIILGGIGFIVAWEVRTRVTQILRRERRYRTALFSLHTDTVLRTTVLLIFGGALALYLIQYTAGSPLTVIESFFLSVTSRTAGFNTVDIGGLHGATLLVVALLMFVGGSPGSAAGGIKTTTFALFVATMFASRNDFGTVTMRGRALPHGMVYQALLLLLFSLTVIGGGVLALLVTDEPFGLMPILFETVSAFGTVGLSTGITPQLSDFSKVIIVLIMYAGRIGTATVFSLAVGSRRSRLEPAEEGILIG